MATDQDWADLLPGVDPDHPVPFDRHDPRKTMRYWHAVEMLQRWHESSPDRFSNKLADVMHDWAIGKIEEPKGQ